MARPTGAGGLWIRVNARDPREAFVYRVAEDMKISPAHAFGLIAATWCGLGELQADGLAAPLPESQIESFAGWTGLPGVFARAFREHCVGPDGVVIGWREKMGKLLSNAEQEAERKRTERAAKKAAEMAAAESHGVLGPSGNGAGTVPGQSADRRTPPLRNVVLKQEAASDPSGSAASLPLSGLSASVLGQSEDYPLADYKVRMASFVERWREKYPARYAEILLLGAETFPPGGEMPEKVRLASIEGFVASTVRLEAGAPDYEQWVVIQRERASAGGA